MKVKTIFFAIGLLLAPMGMQAQVQYGQPTMQQDGFYQQWLMDYEATGNAINEVSEEYQAQVDKRGYPKKKTVKKKMALVEHYIDLLQTQLNDPRLGKDLDRGKVERKIGEWQTQLEDLQRLLKKI